MASTLPNSSNFSSTLQDIKVVLVAANKQQINTLKVGDMRKENKFNMKYIYYIVMIC